MLEPGSVIGDSDLIVLSHIGSGSFGDVYAVGEPELSKLFVVKVEALECSQPMLKREARIVKYLNQHRMSGVPRLYMFDTSGTHRFICMNMLGPSLMDLAKFCGGKLSVKSTLMVGMQLVKRLSHLHKLMLIHQDIKP